MIILNSETKVKPALCLDFDGTIRKSKHGNIFIKDENDIQLMHHIEDKIWDFKNNGFLILGISNQASVAHGYKTPDTVQAEMDKTLILFHKNPFDHVQYCFMDGNGNNKPYNYRSLLRKPELGMLAVMEFLFLSQKNTVIDWDNSIFVGDRPEDEMCAEKSQIKFIHINDFLK